MSFMVCNGSNRLLEEFMGTGTLNNRQGHSNSGFSDLHPTFFYLDSMCKSSAEAATCMLPQGLGSLHVESPLSSPANAGIYSRLEDDCNSFEPLFTGRNINDSDNAPYAASFKGAFGPRTLASYQEAYSGHQRPDSYSAEFSPMNPSSIGEDRMNSVNADYEFPAPASPSLVAALQTQLEMSTPVRRSTSSSCKSSTGASKCKKRTAASDKHTLGSSHKSRSGITSSGAIVPDSSSSIPSPARINHNRIEKQYRTRLKEKFVALLGALPREKIWEAGGEGKISKLEILATAVEHIQKLDGDNKMLGEENKRLKWSVEVFEDTFRRL